MAGFWAVVPRHSGSRPFAMIVASAESAKALRSGEGFNMPDGGVCFATRDRSGGDELELGWDHGMSGTERLWPKTADNPRGGVAAVHTERVVPTADGATLEIVDMFVDPASLGARLIHEHDVVRVLQIRRAVDQRAVQIEDHEHLRDPFRPPRRASDYHQLVS